jgi:hypothetical protein
MKTSIHSDRPDTSRSPTEYQPNTNQLPTVTNRIPTQYKPITNRYQPFINQYKPITNRSGHASLPLGVKMRRFEGALD